MLVSMDNKLAQIMLDAARLAAETAEAINRGDMDAATRLQQAADNAWQRARRLGQQRVQRPAVNKNLSMRERAIRVLTELNVPCSPKLIAAYSQARSGESFDVRAIASIRRDEYRSWTSGSRRDSYLVPALEGPWFVAGRGTFALSHWPLPQRIVGPLSPRTDHLTVCLHLIDQLESSLDAAAEDRMCTLLVEFVRSVPDALANPWQPQAAVDAVRARNAVHAELELIRGEDQKWRQSEADRATRTLDEEQLVWGSSPPHVARIAT
ncbi:MAG TPA: hypothetical protein DCZ75_05290 [Geobacter sp.]|nr:hypothetical protein [Geobacter sp.]